MAIDDTLKEDAPIDDHGRFDEFYLKVLDDGNISDGFAQYLSNELPHLQVNLIFKLVNA